MRKVAVLAEGSPLTHLRLQVLFRVVIRAVCGGSSMESLVNTFIEYLDSVGACPLFAYEGMARSDARKVQGFCICGALAHQS